MTTPATSLLAAQARPQAKEVADIVLAAMIEQGATAAWLEPEQTDRHSDAHHLSIERGDRAVGSAVFGGGLGDAVIARLALLAGVELISSETRTGRTTLTGGDRRVELYVTVRPAVGGLCAELRMVDDAVLSDAAVAAELAGDVPTDLPDGFTLGPYRILGRLGRGGMGAVYEAEHTMLGRACALKVLRQSVCDEDPDSVDRFLREARATARVRHKNIVEVWDVAKLADGRPYLVMEVLEGCALSDMLDICGPLTAERALSIAHDVASGLEAAHGAGVVHRDMSSSNIFIVPDAHGETAKVVDFGAAHLLDPAVAHVPDGPPGIVLGTPWFMAPEQARGKKCDARSDIYSFGVVLFQMLSGSVPFDGQSAVDVVKKHVLEPAPPVMSPRETLPEQLEQLVARMLRKDPSERHQSATELIQDIERVQRVISRGGWRKWLP